MEHETFRAGERRKSQSRRTLDPSQLSLFVCALSPAQHAYLFRLFRFCRTQCTASFIVD